MRIKASGAILVALSIFVASAMLTPGTAHAAVGVCESTETCFWNFGYNSATSSFDQRTTSILTGDGDLRNDNYDVVRGGIQTMHNTISDIQINSGTVYIRFYKGIGHTGDVSLCYSGPHRHWLGHQGFSNNASSFKVAKTSNPSAFCGN